MSDVMTKWVRERVSGGEFVSLSDYFRQLVRDDQGRRRIIAAERRMIEREHQKPFSSRAKWR